MPGGMTHLWKQSVQRTLLPSSFSQNIASCSPTSIIAPLSASSICGTGAGQVIATKPAVISNIAEIIIQISFLVTSIPLNRLNIKMQISKLHIK
jgi:hypothetical protein